MSNRSAIAMTSGIDIATIDGDTEKAVNAILTGVLQHVGKLAVERFQIEAIQMAMGIYKHDDLQKALFR